MLRSYLGPTPNYPTPNYPELPDGDPYETGKRQHPLFPERQHKQRQQGDRKRPGDGHLKPLRPRKTHRAHLLVSFEATAEELRD